MDDINDLSQEDLLRLSALREVLGGFAHEIAQPLNAIMIASQVVQLGIERSALSNEEKAFLLQRLGIVSLQVRRAGTIVDAMRKFIRGSPAGPRPERTDVAAVLESVCALMSQQLSSRGIALKRQLDEPRPTTSVELGIVECVIVHGFGFARDSVESASRRCEDAGISHNKNLQLKLFPDHGDCVVNIRWNIGDPSTLNESIHPISAGLATASSILTSHGGKLEATADSIVIRFPSTDQVAGRSISH
jgi:nitrogen fixation/metabolism regulation signal transduction histidine kinase